MLAILLTHMNDITAAFAVVKICAWPMILFTGLGLAGSTFAVSLLSGGRKPGLHKKSGAETPVSKHFQTWLLVCVIISFIITFSFTFAIQTNLTIDNAQNVLRINSEDLRNEISNNSEILRPPRSFSKIRGSSWRAASPTT